MTPSPEALEAAAKYLHDQFKPAESELAWDELHAAAKSYWLEKAQKTAEASEAAKPSLPDSEELLKRLRRIGFDKYHDDPDAYLGDEAADTIEALYAQLATAVAENKRLTRENAKLEREVGELIDERDDVSEAVQQLDVNTGGDGEYYYSTMDSAAPSTPAKMCVRIGERYDALEAQVETIRGATKNEAAVLASLWATPSYVRLHAGEMKAQEMRSVVAVAKAIATAISTLPNPQPAAQAVPQ